MPKATHTDTTPTPAPGAAPVAPGRRGLLGGAAALLAGAAAIALPRVVQAAGTGPDAALLAACEVFHTIHAAMKDPRRGDTEADDEALGKVILRWYEALDAAVAIPARTTVGQQAKLRTVYIALGEAMHDESLFGHREEFAALTALAELLGVEPVTPAEERDLGTEAAAPTLVYVSPDAGLIRLCDRLAANRAEWLALLNSRHTIEDEKRTEPDNDRLNAERQGLLDKIEAASDPSTKAGAAAMARAALADAPLGLGGHWEAQEDYGWLALTVAEYMVREGVA